MNFYFLKKRITRKADSNSVSSKDAVRERIVRRAALEFKDGMYGNYDLASILNVFVNK